MVEIISSSVAETLALGERIGAALRGGEVIALIGELGTGKTHLVKGLGKGLGVCEDDMVTSPTFTLVNEYEGRRTLVHIDAYRLDDARQLEALGFDEMCYPGNVVVVEWADRVWPLLAEYEPLTVKLRHEGENERALQFENVSDELKEIISGGGQ